MPVKPLARKIGRPPLPEGKQKSRIVPVRFSEAEFERVSRTAKAAGQTVSAWVRMLIADACVTLFL